MIITEQVKELIAIGASVGAHCQPCLTYHVGKAMELGLTREDVAAAIAMGHQVEKGSMMAMKEFSQKLMNAE